MKLLSIEADPKTVKGAKQGYLTAVMYLAPANLSGYEVCPQRSKGCTAACLNTAGHGGIIKKGETSNVVQDARIARTKFYFEDRPAFMSQLTGEIEAFVRKAERRGLAPTVRLNGTSDIPWERVKVPGMANIMGLFPDVQFYDYTKITKRALAHAHGNMPKNYHLTFSLTEDNDPAAARVLNAGGNIAAVFKVTAKKALPAAMRWVDSYLSVDLFKQPGHYAVIDGDESDLRFLEGHAGVIVGLKAKGKARTDTSGFVRS